MLSMRTKTWSLLCGFALLFGVAAASGCGDVEPQVKCSTDDSCVQLAGNLFAGDASTETLPVCCAGQCVVPAGGCETGFRFLTNEPGYGACVTETTCGGGGGGDMSTARDMSVYDAATGG